MDSEPDQRRDQRGATIRRGDRAAVIAALRRLPGHERAQVAERVMTAIARDREPFGGARYLVRAAEEPGPFPRVQAVLADLANRFVRPR